MPKQEPTTKLTNTRQNITFELSTPRDQVNTFEAGNVLKNIQSYVPPRSLYSELPIKFYFETTHNGPLFIRNSADRKMKYRFTDPKTKWHVLDFS